MTVCVATLFYWKYPDSQFRLAAITASDQMITQGDMQYEPDQRKVTYITPEIVVLVAGEYPTNTEAVQSTEIQAKSLIDPTPHQIALIYSQAIQRIRRRYAEDVVLAPLGLNTDTFLAQQREMPDLLVTSLTDQLQRYTGPEVAALIVGTDGENAHIYEIDSNGSVHCMDDACFGAIGFGASQALAHLKQTKYTSMCVYHDALMQTYMAKRRAEFAPGVGAKTDMMLINNFRVEPIEAETIDELEKLYIDYTNRHAELIDTSVSNLRKFLYGNQPENGRLTENSENRCTTTQSAQGNKGPEGHQQAIDNEGQGEAA